MPHSSTSEAIQETVLQDWIDTRQTIYIGIVGFTILVWDHLITIADEIELIWQGPKGILVYLFLLNRYVTPLGFIVNIVAYNLRAWSDTVGFYILLFDEYLNFAVEVSVAPYHWDLGAMTAIGIEIVGLMMLIRICAMYKYQLVASALAVLMLLAWFGVTAWLLSHGEPVNHSDSIHSCTMVFNSGSLASASAWLPLLYDTYVFGLTLYRTSPSIRNKEAGHVVRTLFADGLLYYCVICTVNLVLTIMIIRAQEGVKNIVAQLELLLTVTMMSRITLNLKKQAMYGSSPDNSQVDSIIQSTRNGFSTASGGVVVLSRLRSHSASSMRASSSRVRRGSASSIPPPVRAITFAENPLLFTSRSRLSTIVSVTNTPTILSPIDGSPVTAVGDHTDWPSTPRSEQRNIADIV